jgi:hypothetical protein
MESLRQISRADAEAFADELLQLYSMFTRLLPPGESARKIIRHLERVLDDPEGVRRELVDMIISGEITFSDFVADQAEIEKMLAAPRRILDDVRKELPAGLPGRPATVLDEDFVAGRIQQLLPICLALVVLRSHSTKQTMAASIEYLRPQFPEVGPYLLARVDELEEIFQDRTIKRARTTEGKARIVAYILTGTEAGFQGKQYALRQVRSALLRVKKRQNTNS